MKKLTYIFLAVIAVFVFNSCEKIIQLDLNSTNPKVVIEANIDNEPGPYMVRVRQTVNYDATSENDLTNAIVVMTDLDNGAIDTFNYASNGEYWSNSIQGIIGHSYRCDVTYDGVTYSQTSKINPLVEIDTVTIEITTSPFTQEATTLVTSYFTDPGGTDDFYRTYFFIRQNNEDLGFNDILLSNDPDSEDPTQMRSRFRDESIAPFDTVDVELRHITLETYDYFATLAELIDAGFAPQGIPDNPKSAWSNGALGYFSANSVSKKTIIVQF